MSGASTSSRGIGDRFSDENAGTAAGSHIDRLYVVGNAARYPLVHDVIQNQFELPIVNHQHKNNEPDWENSDPHLGRIVFDKQNQKSSVVKERYWPSMSLKISKKFFTTGTRIGATASL